jgi:hypothetical protein
MQFSQHAKRGGEFMHACMHARKKCMLLLCRHRACGRQRQAVAGSGEWGQTEVQQDSNLVALTSDTCVEVGQQRCNPKPNEPVAACAVRGRTSACWPLLDLSPPDTRDAQLDICGADRGKTLPTHRSPSAHRAHHPAQRHRAESMTESCADREPGRRQRPRITATPGGRRAP